MISQSLPPHFQLAKHPPGLICGGCKGAVRPLSPERPAKHVTMGYLSHQDLHCSPGFMANLTCQTKPPSGPAKFKPHFPIMATELRFLPDALPGCLNSLQPRCKRTKPLCLKPLYLHHSPYQTEPPLLTHHCKRQHDDHHHVLHLHVHLHLFLHADFLCPYRPARLQLHFFPK